MGQLKFYIMTICLFVAGILLAPKAYAQDIFEGQALTFGRFAVVDNSAPRQIIVTTDDDVIYDTGIVGDPSNPGRRGEYTLTGMPANVIFYLGVNIPNPPAEGGVVLEETVPLTGLGSEDFTIGSFKINSNDQMVTDGNGDATLYIGATLTTSGSGTHYVSDTYDGEFTITFYY